LSRIPTQFESTRQELDDIRLEYSQSHSRIQSLETQLANSRKIASDLQKLLEAQRSSEETSTRGQTEELRELRAKLLQQEDDMYRLQEKLDERESDNKTLNADVLHLKRMLAKAEADRVQEIERLSDEMSRLMQELERLGQREQESRNLKDELLRYREEVEALTKARKQQSEHMQELTSVRRHVQSLEADKERLKREFEHAKELLKRELEDALLACQDKDDALADERRAKDALAQVIVGFESQMHQVQSNLRGLATDWDDKERKYALAFSELQRAQAEARRSLVPTSELATVKERLREAERSVQQLQQRLGDAEEQERLARRRADENYEKLEELREKLAKVEESNRAASAEMLEKLQNEREKVAQLEEQESRTAQRCRERERAIGELQTLMASMDGTRGDVEAQLRALMAQDDTSKRRVAQLESEVLRLQAEIRTKEQDKERALSAVTGLDKERDNMMSQLEQREAALRALELRMKEQQHKYEQVNNSTMVAQQQADLYRQAATDADIQLQALRRQLSTDLDHRRQLEQQCTAREEEIRNLTADLATMTRENQVVNAELADMVAQRDALKADLETALEKLRMCEQILQVQILLVIVT
jgi:chromosome segregation ATPase